MSAGSSRHCKCLPDPGKENCENHEPASLAGNTCQLITFTVPVSMRHTYHAVSPHLQMNI